MTNPKGDRPTESTCSVAGCKNPATTTALDTGAAICRKCADRAARDWEAEQREADTIDAIDELLPAGDVPASIRGGIKSLFFEGRDRAAKSTPGVLRTCRTLAATDEWAGLDTAIKAIVALQAGLLIGRDAAAAVLGTFDRRTRTWADAPRTAVLTEEGDPWEPLALDNGAFAEPPAPLATVGRGLLLFGRAVVSVVTHGKQGKTTAIWADAAPVTHRGRVLAIVGARELGPDGRAGYAREIVGLGGDPRNVDILEPVPGTLDRLAGLDLAGRFAAVVIDSAASVCEAEGYDENQAADVDPLLTKIGAWGLPVVCVRHAVNTSNGQSGRDAAASTGAGSRRWLAGVDGEAQLTRDGNRSVLTWRGRTGLPDVTAFELDKGSWPWGVTVEDEPAPAGPGGGGEGLTDQAAEAAVLTALVNATPDQPLVSSGLRSALKAGSKEAWEPYRRAVDRLYRDGRIGASRDPEDGSRKTLGLWLCAAVRTAAYNPPTDSAVGCAAVCVGRSPTTAHSTDEGGAGTEAERPPDRTAAQPGSAPAETLPLTGRAPVAVAPVAGAAGAFTGPAPAADGEAVKLALSVYAKNGVVVTPALHEDLRRRYGGASVAVERRRLVDGEAVVEVVDMNPATWLRSILEPAAVAARGAA